MRSMPCNKAQLNMLMEALIRDAEESYRKGGYKACMSTLKLYAERIRELALDEVLEELFR